MSAGSARFLEIQPSELAFPFQLLKQSSCSMQLTNKTDHYVAFKVKTTNPKQYCVRPNIGVVLPGSTCDVTVMMQAQMKAPPDMQCKDKFLVQSVAADNGATTQDINAEMFNKVAGKVVEEFKLRVVYVPTTSSAVPEDSEQGSSARSFAQGNGTYNSTVQQPASSEISKLNDEKRDAIQQNQKLRHELELLRKESGKSNGGFSLTFLAIVGLLGIIVGYILKKT
ncbi:vesicle-associated protein 1-3 [Oryza brachyantha]|uniref:vesicle-associated protein 1-3 n=1 Tax=Oryza brachyantha TaxID=4533 RepID=UPI0003EAB11B|nr:vesicle-associated protein 1-3 [Oryza brachyantha]